MGTEGKDVSVKFLSKKIDANSGKYLCSADVLQVSDVLLTTIRNVHKLIWKMHIDNFLFKMDNKILQGKLFSSW